MAKGRYDKVDRDMNKITNAFENPNSGIVQVQTCMLNQGYMRSQGRPGKNSASANVPGENPWGAERKPDRCEDSNGAVPEGHTSNCRRPETAHSGCLRLRSYAPSRGTRPIRRSV